MKIQSDYPGRVYFRFFYPNDSWYWVGYLEGTLGEGESIEIDKPGWEYQLELKKENLQGAFLKTPWKYVEDINGNLIKSPDVRNNSDAFHIANDGTVTADVSADAALASDASRTLGGPPQLPARLRRSA